LAAVKAKKGKDVKENVYRRFGMPGPDGYRKALRLMKQAEKFGRPIICFIDTSGAYCGVDAEERGQGEAIARNLLEMSSLTVPVLSVITGEGGSGGALALAVANEIYMLENAVYSVISAKGFASILWKDPDREAEAAELMKMTAPDLFGFGVIHGIINEPDGGAHTDLSVIAVNIRQKLLEGLGRLSSLKCDELANGRYEHFRRLGVFDE